MYEQRVVDRALALSRRGFTDREVARMCNVSVGALRHWRYGTRRRPDGSSRAQRVRASCPRCHDTVLDKTAYAYLLGLYLGDGHIARLRKDVLRLDIFCGDDWPGLLQAAADAMAKVFPVNTVGRRAKVGCTAVTVSSKHVPCLFPQHGPGMKHTRKISLAPWQQDIVDAHTEEFIRGLIHSDGCRCINRVRRPCKDGDRWYEYPRYFFTNASDDIRTLYTDALDHLGIAWKQSNTRIISVARKDAVARLDEFVGPKY